MRGLPVGVCLMLFTIGVPSAPGWAQPCGGTERWAVKVGSDPRASSISLQPTQTSLHDLVSLKTPTLPHDNDTRTKQEMTLRTVSARLLKFKPEIAKNGDGDFHLVMTDETLQFSSGSTVSSHSFVAELVNPDCVPGKKGAPDTTSAWQDQLEDVWEKFSQRFPNPKHGWNDAKAIRIRVTGIGFFDRPHGQTGRAKNMIEIHPVLDIEFLDDAATTAAGLIGNPSFEAGATAWTASSSDIISADNTEPARTGKAKAWLAGTGESRTDRLWQRVSLPASATTITLAFYLHISTEEQSGASYDTLAVRLLATNGTILKTLRTYSNLQERDDYRLESFDLSEFRGRTVRIEFVGREDNGSVTSFVIDDVAVVVQ